MPACSKLWISLAVKNAVRTMNYYEELGVSRTASLAEIRQAYKALVRVLHPDQQQEEHLKRLSELQLRRLNHMLQVLSDPCQRRPYDLSLDRLLPVLLRDDTLQKVSLSEFRGVRLQLRLKPGVLVWLLIAGIAISAGVFWFRAPEQAYPEPVRVTEVKPVQQARKTTNVPMPTQHEPLEREHIEHRSTEPRSIEPKSIEPVSALANTSREPKRPPESVQANSAAATVPATVPAPQPGEPALVASEVAPKAPEYSMSGKWLYVMRHDNAKKGMYPPEYIEMLITRQAGLLKGRYHATYKVTDRPISSEVNFQFEGKQSNAVAVLPWFASNGSRGELRLKRISDDSLEVNWITTSFGNANTLASGTAVLYRSDP